MTRLTITIFVHVPALLLSLTAVAVNGQSSLFVTSNFRNFINYDINTAVAALTSQTVMNNYAFMYMCIINANCVLVIFKSGNVCNVYSSAAVSQVVPASSGSWLYQKQISGYVFIYLFSIRFEEI
jgi:hypothetical protein